MSKRVPARQRREIQAVLTTLHEDPVVRARLALGLVGSFVPVDDSCYDDIRMMRDACEAAGFMGIR